MGTAATGTATGTTRDADEGIASTGVEPDRTPFGDNVLLALIALMELTLMDPPIAVELPDVGKQAAAVLANMGGDSKGDTVLTTPAPLGGEGDLPEGDGARLAGGAAWTQGASEYCRCEIMYSWPPCRALEGGGQLTEPTGDGIRLGDDARGLLAPVEVETKRGDEE